MSEQDLIAYIRTQLGNGSDGTFIDTKFWLNDLEQRFPHVTREQALKHIQAEAAKRGVTAPNA
jgi:hypothetical protein